MSPSEADGIAISAFAYISASEVMVAKFLQETGIEQETVRTAARSPAFLRGVLDYVLADADLTIEVAEALAIKPETLLAASKGLSKLQPNTEAQPKSFKATASPDKGLVSAMPRRSLFRDEGETAA